MDFSTIALFSVVAFFSVLTPGPDVLLVADIGTRHGRYNGLLATAGIVAGLSIHVSIAALGVTGFLLASDKALRALKIAGALYLIYIAISILRAPAIDKTTEQKNARHAFFLRGLLTNLLNPKAALYFMALFPQFIEASSPDYSLQIILLGIIQIVIAACVFTTITCLCAALGTGIKRGGTLHRVQKWVFALLLSGFAIALLWH